MMPKIDPESAAFIAWVMAELSDLDKFKEITNESIYQLRNFYSTGPKLLESLEDKLKKGALEHGVPNYEDQEDVLKNELEMEFLDIIGWTMISRWQRVRKTII